MTASRGRRCCSSRAATVGFAAAFAIPVVLARIFDQAAFGTYKQLFLIYATLYGLAQLGAAESLYYFVPREPAAGGPPRRQRAGHARARPGGLLRWRCSSAGRDRRDWLANPALAA